MANVIIKSDERRAAEQRIARSFGISGAGTASQREAVEVVARRTEEAQHMGRRMEGR